MTCILLSQVHALHGFTPENIADMVLHQHLAQDGAPAHHQATRSSSPKRSKSPVMSQIMQVFPVYRQERTKLVREFAMDSAELIYPASMEAVKKIRRCVLGTRLKKNSRPVVIKLEYDRDVRARYNAQSNSITCGSKANAAADKSAMSVERFIANKMHSQPHFIKFYPEYSHRVRSERVNEPINVYVYDRINKSEDLTKWTKRKRAERVSNKNLEKSLKHYFKQIHSALLALYKQEYVYTDFKPENAMISSNTAYLIDLESVVSKHSRFICLYTAFYAPPTFDQTGRMVSRNGVAGDSARSFFGLTDPGLAHDRVLSWTFCFSIYVLMCSDESQLAELNAKFQHWQPQVNGFVDNFGCKQGQISAGLTNLLNSCLLKIHEKHLFVSLRSHPWFK